MREMEGERGRELQRYGKEGVIVRRQENGMEENKKSGENRDGVTSGIQAGREAQGSKEGKQKERGRICTATFNNTQCEHNTLPQTVG